MLIDKTYYIICIVGLGYLAKIVVGLVIVESAHCALGMLSGRIEAQEAIGAVVVGIIRYHYRTVGRSAFAYDEVRASHTSLSEEE